MKNLSKKTKIGLLVAVLAFCIGGGLIAQKTLKSKKLEPFVIEKPNEKLVYYSKSNYIFSFQAGQNQERYVLVEKNGVYSSGNTGDENAVSVYRKTESMPYVVMYDDLKGPVNWSLRNKNTSEVILEKDELVSIVNRDLKSVYLFGVSSDETTLIGIADEEMAYSHNNYAVNPVLFTFNLKSKKITVLNSEIKKSLNGPAFDRDRNQLIYPVAGVYPVDVIEHRSRAVGIMATDIFSGKSTLIYRTPPDKDIFPLNGYGVEISKPVSQDTGFTITGRESILAVAVKFPWPEGREYCVTRDGSDDTPGSGGVVGSCNFGSHSNPFVYDFDTPNDRDEPVSSPIYGRISYSTGGGCGNGVVVNNGLYQVRLCHNKSYCVKEGDIVNQGDIIAIEGTTGVSNGDHIHFEYEERISTNSEWLPKQPLFEDCNCEPRISYKYTSKNVIGKNYCSVPGNCIADSYNSLKSALDLNLGNGGSTRKTDCLSGSDKADYFAVIPTNRTKYGRINATVIFSDVRLGATAEVSLRNKSGNVLATGRSDGAGGIVINYCTQATRSFTLCNQCDKMYVVVQYNSGTRFSGNVSALQYSLDVSYTIGACNSGFVSNDSTRTLQTRGDMAVTFVPAGPVCPGTLVTGRISGGDSEYYVQEDRSDIQISPLTQVIRNSETFTFIMPSSGDITFSIAPISPTPCESDISSTDFVVKTTNTNCNIPGTQNDFRFGNESSNPNVGSWAWFQCRYLNNLYGGRQISMSVNIEDGLDSRATHAPGSYQIRWEFVNPNTGEQALLGVTPGVGKALNQYQSEQIFTTSPDLRALGWDNYPYVLLRITIISNSDINQNNNVVEIPIGDTQGSGQGDPRVVSTKIVSADTLDITKSYSSDVLRVTTDRWHVSVPGQWMWLKSTFTLPGDTVPTTIIAKNKDRFGYDSPRFTPWIDGSRSPISIGILIPMPPTMPADSTMTLEFNLDYDDMCRSEVEGNNVIIQKVRLKGPVVVAPDYVFVNNFGLNRDLPGKECGVGQPGSIRVKNQGGSARSSCHIMMTFEFEGRKYVVGDTVIPPISAGQTVEIDMRSSRDFNRYPDFSCRNVDSLLYGETRLVIDPEKVLGEVNTENNTQTGKNLIGVKPASAKLILPDVVYVGDTVNFTRDYTSPFCGTRVQTTSTVLQDSFWSVVDSRNFYIGSRTVFKTPGVRIVRFSINENTSGCPIWTASDTEKVVVLSRVIIPTCTTPKPKVTISYANRNVVPCIGTVFVEKIGSDTVRLLIPSTNLSIPFTTNVSFKLPAGQYDASVKVCDSVYRYKLVIDCSATKIQEEKEIQLQVSPNPTNQNITISSLEMGMVEVYDVLGRLVIQREKKENEIQVQMNIPNGTYIVVLKTKEGRMGMRKVVKIE